MIGKVLTFLFMYTDLPNNVHMRTPLVISCVQWRNYESVICLPS